MPEATVQEPKTTIDEHGRVFYDIGDVKTSDIIINTKPKPKSIMNAPRKRGDRNFYQQRRLKGHCPKCKMIVPCVQTVDRHKYYAIVKHWCKYCSKLLHIQKYPIAEASKFHDDRNKRWV